MGFVERRVSMVGPYGAPGRLGCRQPAKQARELRKGLFGPTMPRWRGRGVCDAAGNHSLDLGEV
mgnify:CR=1 FL=1